MENPVDIPGRREIVDSVKSLFGPAGSEFGQLVADRVRFWRWRSARKIIERVNEIREEEKLSDVEISLKFFLPFVEEASKEPEDGEVSELWARLLAGSNEASTGFDLICINILKKLGSTEAALLNTIWRYMQNRRNEISKPMLAEYVSSIANHERSAVDFGRGCLEAHGYFLTDISFSVEHLTPCSAGSTISGEREILCGRSAMCVENIAPIVTLIDANVISEQTMVISEQTMDVLELPLAETGLAQLTDIYIKYLDFTPIGMEFIKRCMATKETKQKSPKEP